MTRTTLLITASLVALVGGAFYGPTYFAVVGMFASSSLSQAMVKVIDPFVWTAVEFIVPLLPTAVAILVFHRRHIVSGKTLLGLTVIFFSGFFFSSFILA